MHLLIDNYDSFTYNVVQALGQLGAEVTVRRNDRIGVDEALALPLRSLIVSPGPGTPADAGVSLALIRALAGRVPVLGICLGHQCIVEAFGGTVGRAAQVMHGKTSRVYHEGGGLYAGLSNPFLATRYHSLVAETDSLPATLEVTARTSDGVIMGVRHRELPVEGVQFHPESVLSTEGPHLLANFLELCEPREADHAAPQPGRDS